MRRASRVDGNQPVIVKALRRIGALVTPTHMVGNGFPDLVAFFHGGWHLLEVKDPSQPPNKRKLTPAEKDFHRAHGGKVHIVETVEQAIAAVGAHVRPIGEPMCECPPDEVPNHTPPCPQARTR